jgi:hypothetical protein
MPSISAQFSLLTLHLEVAWVYITAHLEKLFKKKRLNYDHQTKDSWLYLYNNTSNRL